MNIEIPDKDNSALVGWICPKCGRVLSPWMSECPCYLEKTTITVTTGTSTPVSAGNGKCDKVCSNKTNLGYCKSTVCINPIYSGGYG